MKKHYVSPDILVESFLLESFTICSDISGVMPAGTGDNNVPIGDL